MKDHGIFKQVSQEIGDIIVAEVDQEHVVELLEPDGEELKKLIRKEGD